jgi:hypothetical protein
MTYVLALVAAIAGCAFGAALGTSIAAFLAPNPRHFQL